MLPTNHKMFEIETEDAFYEQTAASLAWQLQLPTTKDETEQFVSALLDFAAETLVRRERIPKKDTVSSQLARFAHEVMNSELQHHRHAAAQRN
ncbi:MAG: hypothetical protein O3B13_23725 [Planctomycetota bacterium]|nr:hypothetical protein [Planctomycetota bacterium]